MFKQYIYSKHTIDVIIIITWQSCHGFCLCRQCGPFGIFLAIGGGVFVPLRTRLYYIHGLKEPLNYVVIVGRWAKLHYVLILYLPGYDVKLSILLFYYCFHFRLITVSTGNLLSAKQQQQITAKTATFNYRYQKYSRYIKTESIFVKHIGHNNSLE